MTGSPKATSMTIDTHHHMVPDFFWRETENAHAPVGGLAPHRWSKEASLSFMDDAGIDVAVVSLSTPGVHTGDSAKASALARQCNEFAAELVHARRDRLGFACIPLPDIDASLEELSYALDVLGLDGFVVFTNSNGVYLGDAVLEPVFEELERRNAVVYVLLYGTDFPYLRRDLAVKSKRQILQSSALNDLERRAILGGNASRLFLRLHSVRANGDSAMRRSPAAT
jgi:predicted TIM-barrel fold metal-dependent hydrolase